MLVVKFTDARFMGGVAEVPKDFLGKTLESFRDEYIDSLKLNFTGNDMKPLNGLITSLIGKFPEGAKRGALKYVLSILKERSDSIRASRDLRILPIKTKEGILYDLRSRRGGISLQLLKVDRYTGIGSLESGSFSGQVTTYYSPEATLLALLGTASAYSTTFRSRDGTYYYLVTFTPDQLAEIVYTGKKEVVERYLELKDEVKEVVAQIMTKYPSNELLITELALNLRLSDTMIRNSLDKVDLFLIKLASEGQTYKVYEQIPITVVRNPPFYKISSIRDPNRLRTTLWEIVDPGRSRLIWSVASIGKRNQRSEANNALRALLYLYRFVILGDPQGLFEFARELNSCYRICEASKGKGCSTYLEYLRNL